MEQEDINLGEVYVDTGLGSKHEVIIDSEDSHAAIFNVIIDDKKCGEESDTVKISVVSVEETEGRHNVYEDEYEMPYEFVRMNRIGAIEHSIKEQILTVIGIKEKEKIKNDKV